MRARRDWTNRQDVTTSSTCISGTSLPPFYTLLPPFTTHLPTYHTPPHFTTHHHLCPRLYTHVCYCSFYLPLPPTSGRHSVDRLLLFVVSLHTYSHFHLQFLSYHIPHFVCSFVHLVPYFGGKFCLHFPTTTYLLVCCSIPLHSHSPTFTIFFLPLPPVIYALFFPYIPRLPTYLLFTYHWEDLSLLPPHLGSRWVWNGWVGGWVGRLGCGLAGLAASPKTDRQQQLAQTSSQAHSGSPFRIHR